MTQFDKKTVFVSGATRGIGASIAQLFIKEGATVYGSATTATDAQQLGLAGMFAADFTQREEIERCADFIRSIKPDILINNAGMSGNFGPGEPLDLALTDQAIFLNLNAPLHLIGHLLPGLLQRPEASIVNVTSGLAIAPRAGGPVYCATKAGLRSFTQSLRHNLRDTNVHVIEALPPVVDTAMTRGRVNGKKMSAKECAAEIIDAIATNAPEANVGMVKLLRLVYSISPALAQRIMIRF